MPVSPTSRYFGLTVYSAADDRGETHATVAIRPHQPPPADAFRYRHVVNGAEDIEYLAWRYLGDSRQWWRIAEANALMFPLDIRPGVPLTIALTDQVGRIVRDRTF
jgi:hypothetical protein